MIGQVIGNFRLVSVLGRGGMGEVYLAEHTGIQTRVAVKVLLPEISRDTQHVQRLFNEARIVSRIHHAGIVRIFDVGFHGPQAYLIMELLDGESLAQRIARGRMAGHQLADVCHQIADVLAATHAAGITHRDLKPDNIYLVRDAEGGRRERVKVLDFGIAKLAELAATSPRTIGTMGTPAYMAPEQWGDSASVDWRADAYSLGCVAYEMITGAPPFPATTIAEAYRAHTQSPPPSPRARVPELAPELDQLVVQLLAKDPAARARSMRDVARTFERWAGAQVAITLPPGSDEFDSVTGTAQPIGRAVTTLGASNGQVAATPRRTAGLVAGAMLGAAVAAASTVMLLRTSSSDGDGEGARPAAAPPAALVQPSSPPASAALVQPSSPPAPAALVQPPAMPTKITPPEPRATESEPAPSSSGTRARTAQPPDPPKEPSPSARKPASAQPPGQPSARKLTPSASTSQPPPSASFEPARPGPPKAAVTPSPTTSSQPVAPPKAAPAPSRSGPQPAPDRPAPAASPRPATPVTAGELDGRT